MRFINLIFPQTCLICDELTLNQTQVCPACKRDLPWNFHSCTQCAMPLISDNLLCGQCIKNPPVFSRTICAFEYTPPISHWILALKFRQQLQYAALLGNLLSETISLMKDFSLPQIIVPVPLHKRRLRQRGFNQAVEIGKIISKKLNIPLSRTDYVRKKNTDSQSTLSAEERQRNIKNAFQEMKKINYSHVAILDDVMTTSSTVSEFARVLLKNNRGIKIEVWCCARAS